MHAALGHSWEGREVGAYANFDLEAPRGVGRLTLLIGGTHGDERATVPILEDFVRTQLESGAIQEPVVVIPLLNPDGHARDTRYNARGVDLNRNFPHHWSADGEEPAGESPLSEPEARILHAFILAHRPAKIVSLHWALGEIDADGLQSAPLARAMWKALGPESAKPYRLRVQEERGRIDLCPGSLGQWCGHGLVYPDGTRPAMVTLELPHHQAATERSDPLPADHFQAVKALWAKHPDVYLAGVEPAVHRALSAACAWKQAPESSGG